MMTQFKIQDSVRLVGGPPVRIRFGAWDGEFKTFPDLVGCMVANRWDDSQRWFVTGFNGSKYVLFREDHFAGDTVEYRTARELSLCFYLSPPRTPCQLASLN
jgi:hypothetical protein